jgi:hypothetical protein
LSGEDVSSRLNNLNWWESELWYYINRGDGLHCPLFSSCQLRLSGGWCLSEHPDYYKRAMSSYKDNRGNCDFLEKYCHNRVDELIQKLAINCLYNAGITSPPVKTKLFDIFRQKYNIEYHLVPLKLIHGAVWKIDNRWIVHIREQDPSNLQRFTLFHEIFHILAHSHASDVKFKKRNSHVGAYNEMQASHFASSILMPLPWVLEMWPDIKDVNKMAEIFQVTPKAMYFKLKWIHQIK